MVMSREQEAHLHIDLAADGPRAVGHLQHPQQYGKPTPIDVQHTMDTVRAIAFKHAGRTVPDATSLLAHDFL